MKNKKVNLILLIFCALHSFYATASVKRISAKISDLSKVDRVFISPGLASVVIFPKPITEVKLGNPDLIKATISKTLPSEMTLLINKDLKSPTNIIVRCGSRNYVFDVFPTQNIHQDIVKVMASFGGPEFEDNQIKLIDSSEKTSNQMKNKTLIDSSDHK